MSEVADRYRRLAADFTGKVGQVPEDRWSSPSPCEGWTARDVVRHLIEASGIFLGFVNRSVPAPSVDDDPLGAWQATSSLVQESLDDPGVAGTEYDGFFGRTTFEQSVDRFLCGDVLIHGWDLARATGLDERLDLGEVRRVLATARSFGEAARSPGVFGPEVEAPPDADDQTKLLAYTGRRV